MRTTHAQRVRNARELFDRVMAEEREKRDRRREVRALLRKARATMECWDHRSELCILRACPTLEREPHGFLWLHHVESASALLEGLDIRDVTEAGG